MRCLRRVVRFDPATICLALTFVFLSAAGAVAQAPLVAHAGPDQPMVVSGTEVQLDGTDSTESDGSRSVTYLWTRANGSAGGTGSPVTLSDKRALRPTFTAPTLIPGADRLTPGADSVTYIFTLTVTDDQGSAQATDMVKITVTARPFAVTGFDQKVPPGWPVVLDGKRSAAAAGTGIRKYTWFSVEVAPECDEAPKHTIEGSQARFTAEDLAPGAADVTYCFFLQVEQSNGVKSSVVGPLKVTVSNRESPYMPPVAMIAGGDREIASGGTVTLSSGGTTVDERTFARYRWERTDGTSTATGILTGETFRKASFTAETLDAGAPDVTHILTLTVTDFQGGSSTATVTITVTAALVANAGPDQLIIPGKTVTLDGSGSTASGGGRIVTYAWTRAGGTGSEVNLSDTTVVDPTFTAQTLNPGDASVSYIFTLTVTDDAGSTAVTDTVTIKGISATADPVAQAGDDVSVGSGGTVTLNGNRSTVDYRRNRSKIGAFLFERPPMLYSWVRTGGTSTATGTLTGATTATPSFTAETLTPGAADVTHIFTLTVTDSANVTATDTVTITVTTALVANAGPDQPRRGQPTIFSGETVTLDGSGSTASGGGRTVTYGWTQTGGDAATVTLSDTTVLNPSFTAQTLNPGTADVTYIFTLTVTDSANETDTDTVTITVRSEFAALVAEAGEPQTVDSGDTVTLEGSGTATGGGRTVTYDWSQSGGDAALFALSDDTNVLDPSFTAETLTRGAADVIYVFTLAVTDDQGSTAATDTVTITVEAPPFGDLVAEAGDPQTVDPGDTVTLEGSGTATGGGRNVTYAWTQTGGDAATVTLSDTTVLRPTFTAQALTAGAADVTYVFTLTVSDDQGSTAATDTVTITVEAPPLAALVAEAGTGGSVDSGTQNVELDGTGSTETVGVRTVTYAWARTGGTGDDTVAPSNPAALQTSFTAETLNPGDASVTHIFTLTVTDNQGSTQATDTVTFTVTAPLAALVAEAGTGQTVDSGTRNVPLDGTGSTETVGVRTVTYAWARTGGTGDDTVAPSNPAALQTSFTAETLNPGDASVTHIFTLTVTDNQGSTQATDTVTFTVTAPLAALVAEAGTDQTVDSGTRNVELDGTGSTETVGVRTVTYAWARTGGTGDDTVAPSNPAALQTSFTAETLNPGDASVTHIFTLTVTDNQGSTQATDTVTFTVTAPLAALVAEAGTGQTVDSGTRNVPLDGTGSTETVGVRTVTYAWARTGGTGDDTVAPSNPAALQTSFTAETLNPGDASVTHIFTLTVTDNQGSTQATDTVTFTVTAPLAALVAEAGTDQTVDSGTRNVELDGTGSTETVGVRTVTYAWARTGGTGDDTVAPSNPAALQTSFTAETLNPGDASVTHIFTLTVTDNQGSTQATDTVTFTVTAPLAALVAEAGTDQTVDSGTRNVPLDGTGSTETVGVRNVAYAWARTGGTGDDTVAPSNPAALQTSFTAETLNPGDASVTHIFTLTVTDNQGSTQATDTVTFTVTAPLAALVAEAGTDQTVDSGTRNVPLDGTGSTETVGVRTVTYAWARTGGTGDDTVAPSNPAALQTSFTAETLNPGDASVTHIFTLTVTDNQGSTQATDTVTFTVTAPLAALVAEAGTDQTVDSGTRNVELDGTGSTETVGVRTVAYAWARTGGTGDDTVAPSNPAALQTSFTAETLNPGDASVTHIFTLTVTDNQGSTQATDTVTFTVTAPLAALVAEAGTDQTVDSGTRNVPLDGTGSTETVGVRTVTYAWARTGGTGDDTVAPSNPAALQTSFTAETLNPGDASVTHIFTLTVTDNQGSTQATDTVTFTVTAPLAALVAEAGTDQTVDSGTRNVELDGTGSTETVGVRTVTYAWARTGGTGDDTVAPSNPAALQTSFTAETLNPGDASVTHIFTLTVTDNQGSTQATDTVTFTVTAPLAALVAEAGTDQTVDSGTRNVELDGTGSTETVGVRTVTYAWARTGGTGDDTVAPSNPAALQTSFTAETLNPGDASVTHIFTLTVTDNQGSTQATDTVTFTVTAPLAALVAEAGTDQTVDSGTRNVPLDGTGSTETVGVRTVTYAWARTGGTGDDTVAPSNPAALQTSFTAETLNPGDASVTHIFTLTVTDNQGSTQATDTVTFTVTAPLAALVAEAGTDQTVDSGTRNVELDGTGSTETVGVRTVTYAWARTGGTGDDTVAPSNPAALQTSFTAETLNPGDASVTHIFTLTVTDNQGSTQATDTVTFTVTAPLAALVAEAGTDQTVDSGTRNVELDGTGSTETVGVRTVTYAWARTGGTGDDTVAPSNPAALQTSFTAETLNPGDASVTHIFTLTVTDNQGSTQATDTVTFTVTAPLAALVAEAGTGQTVDSGTRNVELDGTGSTETVGVRTVTYAWARTGGTGDDTVAPSNPAALQTSFTAETLNPGDASVTHIFTLTVTDNQGSTQATDTVTFTVTAPLAALVAEAGTDQTVDSGTRNVELDGTGSTETVGVRTVTYAWARTGGTGDDTVAPSNPAALQTSFTAETLNPGDASVTHIFTLTVTDNQGSTQATDTVTFTVTAPLAALVAEAGTGQTVDSGTRNVPLDGTGSTETVGVRTVTYAWARTGGTGDDTVAPSNPAALQTSFTAETLNPGDASVTHIFTLTVTDNQGSTQATDTVTFTVTAPLAALVAEAGTGQTVDSGTRNVPLDGTGSTETVGVRTVTYAWARTGGTGDDTVAPSNPAALQTSFTAETLNPGDASVTHIFTLTVTDNQGSTQATDTVTFTVTAPLAALVAEAGTDQTVDSGTRNVPLDGTGSTETVGVRTVTYAWARTGGTGDDTVAPSNPAALQTSFTAEALNPGDASVTHIFTLTVTDNQGSTQATDTVTFTVTAPLAALVAEAGTDQTVDSGTRNVELDGTGSTETVGVRTVTYAWARTGGTGDDTVAPSNPAALQTSFTAETLNPGDASVTHIFTLTVTDNQGSTQATDTVTFTVTAPLAALVAEAGTDQTVDSGTRNVELDGTGSTETVGVRTVTYAWARTGGTGDDTVAPSNPAALQTSFTAETLNPGDASVTHIFTLTVTDNQGSTQATDTVTFTVTAPLAALVAEAGDARSVVSGTQGVELDGTGSTLTGGGRAVTYLWDRTGGDGATVTLTDADTLQPSFTAQTLAPGDAAVTYIFTLTVTDDQSSAAATDTVTITAVPVDILDSPFELIGVSPLLFGLIVSAVDILVSPSELTVQEGGSSAYQVRLSESPGQDVTVTAVSDNENVVLENAQLTFNANNWDAWQEIRIGTVAGSENADGKTLIEHRLDTGGVALRQSGVVNVTVREEEPVLRPVGENLTARATTLLNNLPNLSSFLKQDRTTPGGSGGFTFKATNGRLTLDGGFVRDGVWGEIAGSYTRSDSGDTRFVLGSFGIHRKYSEHFLAGAMLQIDLADHDLDGKSGSIDGTGWLVGPYFAARHGTWPLYFEGRLLYGQSDNDIRFNDSDLGKKMRMGSFDTTRMLAQFRLEGEIALSDGDGGPRLIPYADTHWFEDRAAAFTDSIGTRISGQTVSIGQLELGSNVEVPIAMSHGAMTFTGGLGLVYSNTEGDYIPSVSRSRGRGEIGFSYGLDDNVRIDFESFYDGIGTSGYEGYGLSLNAEIKF